MRNTLDAQVEKLITSKRIGRLKQLLQSKYCVWIVALISFLESALPVPLITDPFMTAAILANRNRTMLIVCVTIISSVIGGMVAFTLAFYSFEFIASHMTPALQAEFQRLVSFGESDTVVATLTGAVTPIPYTIVAWVVAVAGGSFWIFILASIVGRGIRYGIVGYCTYLFGPAALRYASRSLGITSLVFLILAGAYVWLKM